MKHLFPIWLNGKITDDAPVFCASDRLRLGQGAFDTLLVHEGRPVQEEAHFERLIRHAGVLGIESPYGTPELIHAARALIAACGSPPGRHALNTLITMGPAARGLAPPENPSPQTVMRLSPLPPPPQGILAITATVTRRNEHSPLSRIKSCNYGDNLLAMDQARRAGAQEAILLSTAGALAGACAGTLYALLDGWLLTPPLADGAMESISRAHLLRQGAAAESSLQPADLLRAQGVFIGNALKGLVPVLRLDGKNLARAPLPIDPDFYLL